MADIRETENLLTDSETPAEEREGDVCVNTWTFGEFQFFGNICIIVQVFGFFLFRTILGPHFTTYSVVLNDHCSNTVAATCPRANIACARMYP
jgi:hypothetical protein